VNAKHTPGPWRLSDPLTIEGENAVLCALPYCPAHHEEMAANAHLISSAPDMLAALEAALALLQDPDATDTDANKVETLLEAAILKAKGEA